MVTAVAMMTKQDHYEPGYFMTLIRYSPLPFRPQDSNEFPDRVNPTRKPDCMSCSTCLSATGTSSCPRSRSPTSSSPPGPPSSRYNPTKGKEIANDIKIGTFISWLHGLAEKGDKHCDHRHSSSSL